MSEIFVHVVGARPNFMKAAPVVNALKALGAHQQIVHTGQHYDVAMSEIFFEQLGLPEPDVNLGVGSGSHAQQTAQLLIGLEEQLTSQRPGALVVYGDINSTLAAALVASKLEIPLAHVEAGLRSFDDTMPEEINRRVTDQLSGLLLVTSPEGMGHLAREGCAAERMRFVGNPMIDTLLANLNRFDSERVRARVEVSGDYGVVTLHRPSNVDDPRRARELVNLLGDVSTELALVFPVHPRGRRQLDDAGLSQLDAVRVVDPLGYVDFLSLVRGSRLVLTDSGGLQEETTVLGIPCLTLRPNTERPITISHGTNQLVDLGTARAAFASVLEGTVGAPADAPPLWDGRAGPRIARELMRPWT